MKRQLDKQLLRSAALRNRVQISAQIEACKWDSREARQHREIPKSRGHLFLDMKQVF